MNLLCPNCQKPLTVPEQYAGQPMRCPLCQGTFTVPAPPAPPPPLDFGLPPGPSSVTGAPPPPSGPPPTYTEDHPSFPAAPTPEGYQRKYTVWFSPRVLQYVAPVALFLVFVLTFFAWTG